jgi:hypothetical protein
MLDALFNPTAIAVAGASTPVQGGHQQAEAQKGLGYLLVFGIGGIHTQQIQFCSARIACNHWLPSWPKRGFGNPLKANFGSTDT